MSKKSLTGWMVKGQEIHFEGRNPFSEIEVPNIYKTKKGVYFHNGIFSEKDMYKISPVKVKITIEDILTPTKAE